MSITPCLLDESIATICITIPSKYHVLNIAGSRDIAHLPFGGKVPANLELRLMYPDEL
jgi:hypothetical protein